MLAESADGVEVFQDGRCLAVQFHPEMTPRLLERWLSLPGGPPPGLDLPSLRADTRQHAPDAARATGALLDRLLRSDDHD